MRGIPDAAALWLLLTLGGCEPTDGPVVVTLMIEQSDTTIQFGFTLQLRVTARDERGGFVDPAGVRWTTSDTGVAVVDESGLARAVGPGAAILSAHLLGATDAVTLTVPALAFRSISPGDSYTCGVSDQAVAYCWGENSSAQLGDGTRDTGLVLTASPVVGSLRFDQVSSRYRHSCGRVEGGTGYCWGWNFAGQLGNEGGSLYELVPASLAGGLTFQEVHAGSWFSCGLTPSAAAYCWGLNSDGSVGDGTTMDRTIPTAVTGAGSFISLTTGALHACGLTDDGSAFCWGQNTSGQLGDGSTTNRSQPVAVTGGLVFKYVSAALAHTCGVTTAGMAYCWGSNGEGRLGDGTEDDRREPTPVVGGLSFETISAAGLHTCGLSATGEAYCWGDNLTGRLGQPPADVPKSATPVPVLGGLTFQWLAAGGGHACGLAADGLVHCWGSNPFGQLGRGTATFGEHVPAPIRGQR